MGSRLLLATILAIVWTAGTRAEESSIQILEPRDGVNVEHRTYIRGTVSEVRAEVWVVIHPIDTSGFWIQPLVTIKNDGSWKVNAYFGRSGQDTGEEFEIRAFVNPSAKLHEGKAHGWPDAAARSDVVHVIRK